MPLPRTALRVVTALGLAVASAGALPVSTAAADGVTVSGAAYRDDDRDGRLDAGEQPWAGLQVTVHESGGRLVATAVTDGAGRYAVAVAPGSYTVRLDAIDWQQVRADWVPTTTGSLHPVHAVAASGPVSADFGLRRIVRSRDVAAPLTSYTAPSGLVVRSYNDAVDARTVHDALARGSLSGGERSTTTVSFDYPTATSCVTGLTGGPGSYGGFTASIWVDYLSWLDSGDSVLFHEYGHAWAEYHEHIVQQDGTFASYLRARGLTGDLRLGSDKYWSVGELIAEDYRQLFGSANAASYPQANRDIPSAAAVPGLREFLSTTYVSPPVSDPGGSDPTEPAPALTVTAPRVSPTPVTKSATVTTASSAPATVRLVVRDSRGAPVRTLLRDVVRPAGEISAAWDRKDDAGRRVKAGTYVVVVTAVDSGGRTASAETAFRVV